MKVQIRFFGDELLRYYAQLHYWYLCLCEALAICSTNILAINHTLGAHGDKAPLNAKKDQMWPFLLGISPQFTGVISSCVAKPTSPGVAANTPTHDSALITWGCCTICHNTMHSRILCIVYKYYAYHVFPWYSIIPFLWYYVYNIYIYTCFHDHIQSSCAQRRRPLFVAAGWDL